MNRNAGRRSLLGPATLVCAVAFMLFTIPTLAQPPSQTLQGHVPSAVSNGQTPFVSALPGTQQLRLSIALPMRNRAELEDLLNQLYDPSSPNYRQFLTVPQFTQMFGPTVDDYNAVVNFAQANGFTVTGTPADRMSVPIQGTVAQIESAFHVKMNVYQHPTENRMFFSPDREPSLNLGVPVQFISGLNSFSRHHPAVSKGNGRINSSGAGPGGSYLPSDMRAAYYTSTSGQTGLTGTGQCVSLVEFDGYKIGDVVSTFDDSYDYDEPSGNNYILVYYPAGGGVPYGVYVDNVSVNGGSVGTYDSGEVEVVLDIAQAVGMAPGANVRVYIAPPDWTYSGNYEFPSTPSGYSSADDLAVFEQMIYDFSHGVGCNQASMSWNWSPQTPLTDPDNSEFDEMATVGISFFNASGDYGSWESADDGSIDCYDGRCFVYPEEYPNLTAVGGTALTTSGPNGSWNSESGWSNSGGGISLDDFLISSEKDHYQSGLNGINGTSTTYRNAPDVAMEANWDNYVCAVVEDPTCQGDWGGTSFAAPRWAAFTALMNEQAGANGITSLGFLNPSIYPIGESQNYLTDFNEIAGGSNGGYSVVAGEYNMVTGWGSPKGQTLVNALAGSPPTTATPSNSGSYTIEGWEIDFTITLYDDTPGAQIYYQTSCPSSAGEVSSGGSFDVLFQIGSGCSPSGTMYATAPGYIQSGTASIDFP